MFMLEKIKSASNQLRIDVILFCLILGSMTKWPSTTWGPMDVAQMPHFWNDDHFFKYLFDIRIWNPGWTKFTGVKNIQIWRRFKLAIFVIVGYLHAKSEHLSDYIPIHYIYSLCQLVFRGKSCNRQTYYYPYSRKKMYLSCWLKTGSLKRKRYETGYFFGIKSSTAFLLSTLIHVNSLTTKTTRKNHILTPNLIKVSVYILYSQTNIKT